METAPPPSPMRRPRGRVVLAAVFLLLGLSAWWQAVADVLGMSNEPMPLTVQQVIVGALALASAWGAWKGARWAPVCALLYGVMAAVLVWSVGPAVDLKPEERRGLWFGAAIVLAFGVWSAWWLRRSLDRERARATPHIVGFD